MTARKMLAIGLVALAAGTAVTTAALSRSARRMGPPALRDASVPQTDVDVGRGERLLLVVGGSFATQEEAEAANARIRIGDLQGFYVARTDQFDGLDQVIGDPTKEFVLASAFRTSQGAREFLDLVQTGGYPAFITPRLENLGDQYVGLGQETDPNGGGRLTDPIPGLTT
jgi:hypothetical protein